jgi:hypothetical protein
MTIPATAQEWPRLPDGRLVIDIQGVRLAFPAQGPELDDIDFHITSANALSLRRVISEPDTARGLFAPSGVQWIWIPNLLDRAGLFLGRFDRQSLGWITFTVAVGPDVQGNCRAWQRTFDHDRARAAAGEGQSGAGGWTEFQHGRDTPAWSYVRPRDPVGLPKHFDSLSCDSVGGCSASVCVGANASFTYRIGRNTHPRETWAAMTIQAADVFRSIFIDHSGDRGGRP